MTLSAKLLCYAVGMAEQELSDLGIPKRAGFYPTGSLEGKRNYKRLIRVERDGSATDCVLLRVLDDRLREDIICRHFLCSRLPRLFDERVGVRYESRDAPWDFELSLSTGNHFWLEITAIAQDEHEFATNKSEEMLEVHDRSATLPFSLVRKLHRKFPSERSGLAIASAHAQGSARNALVPNPWRIDGTRLFQSRLNPRDTTLFELVSAAIADKSAKKHDHKDQTILIVDNRASAYDMNDFVQASQRFDELRDDCPFQEVWFYTGFYSDEDGNNSEYVFLPISLPAEIEAIFRNTTGA